MNQIMSFNGFDYESMYNCDRTSLAQMATNKTMHSTLTKTLFILIGSIYFTLIAINICTWMNNHIFVDKLLQTTVSMIKASCVENTLRYIKVLHH